MCGMSKVETHGRKKYAFDYVVSTIAVGPLHTAQSCDRWKHTK